MPDLVAEIIKIKQTMIEAENLQEPQKQALNIPVSHSNLTVGMRVKDREGNIGTVKECDDIHNVFVEYDNGGSGLHCLVEGCIETTTVNDQLVEIPHCDHSLLSWIACI